MNFTSRRPLSTFLLCFRDAALAGMLLAGPVQVEAATYYARSASRADVGAAVALAKDGDIVSVPAGTATWTTSLTIGNNITLQGAGSTSTIIVNGITGPASRPPIVSVSLSRDLPFRMTGFTFKGGVATAEDTNGEVRCTGISHSFRVDHCTFDQLCGVGLAVNGFLWGVIDHCRFNTQRMHPITVEHKDWNGKNNGNGSWADDPYWGTERFIFIEDNVFEDTSSVGTGIDSFEGARFVVRYNQLHNTRLVMHGTEGQGRGAKQAEEYNNTYVNDVPSQAGQIRSGTIITHDNTWTNVAGGHSLQAFRLFQKSPHWGPANGKNLYDQNDPQAATGYWERGTHTGAAGSTNVVDSTKHWTPNQWCVPGTVFMVRNITTETALTLSYVWAIANTSNAITCTQIVFEKNPRLTFNPGDTYEIWKVNQVLDQPGSGKTVLLPGMGNWPTTMQAVNQVDEPCYSWNNKNATKGVAVNLGSTEPQMTEGHAFFNNVVKPNYKPYTYPHPLTSLAPPANLQVVGGP